MVRLHPMVGSGVIAIQHSEPLTHRQGVQRLAGLLPWSSRNHRL
jgi:hypothetical protein